MRARMLFHRVVFKCACFYTEIYLTQRYLYEEIFLHGDAFTHGNASTHTHTSFYTEISEMNLH